MNLEKKNESSFQMPMEYFHIHKDHISWYLKKLTQNVNTVQNKFYKELLSNATSLIKWKNFHTL